MYQTRFVQAIFKNFTSFNDTNKLYELSSYIHQSIFFFGQSNSIDYIRRRFVCRWVVTAPVQSNQLRSHFGSISVIRVIHIAELIEYKNHVKNQID